MKDLNEQHKIERNLKLIAKSSFIVFIGLLISKVLTYVYRITIARSFGPEIYGLFSVAIMVLGWFMLFASFGFSEGLIRYVSFYIGKKQYSKIRYLFLISTTITLIFGIISTLLLFLLSEFISIRIFHNPNLTIFLRIFSFLIPIYLVSNIFLSILQAYEKINWYSFIINIVQNFVRFIALVIFILIGFKINSVIYSYFLGFVAMLLVAYFVCRYQTKEIFQKQPLEKKIKKQTAKEFFSYSWPLIFTMAISEIFYWTDSFFIGFFKGVTEVGYYNAAIPIALLLAFVPEIFIKLFFPIITKEYSQKRLNVVKQISQQVGKWVLVLNLPIFLIILLFPGAIINLLFGPQYLVASNALRILSVGAFVSSLVWISYSLLSMAGKTKIILKSFLAAAVLNILLNLILIPPYGVNGAAIATTFSKIVFSFILIVQVKKNLSIIPFRRKLFGIFILSLIPLSIVLLIRKFIEVNLLSLVLASGLFFLLYFLLIFVTNSLDKNDFMIIKSINKQIFT